MGGQKSKILRTRTAWGRTLVQATPLAAGIPPCHHHIWLAPPPPARFMCGMCQHGGRRCAQRTEEGPSLRRVRPLRLHAARAAPASLLGMAAFHLHLTALRACCACTALLALMRRAHMRVPAEACEGAAGTYDLAADDAPPASAVARVSCRMAAAARVPSRPHRARKHPLPILAARFSALMSAAACLTGSHSSTKSASM